MAAAGLVAPEMQITDAISALIVPNNMFHYLYRENPPLATAPVPSPMAPGTARHCSAPTTAGPMA
jgi:hypothetical protein